MRSKTKLQDGIRRFGGGVAAVACARRAEEKQRSSGFGAGKRGCIRGMIRPKGQDKSGEVSLFDLGAGAKRTKEIHRRVFWGETKGTRQKSLCR